LGIGYLDFWIGGFGLVSNILNPYTLLYRSLVEQ
jgi:hypothetical protein